MRKERTMLVSYDATVDALYISFRRRADGDVARTAHLDARRLIDYDADGRPLGAEFLDASAGIDLDGIPEAETVHATLGRIPHGAQPQGSDSA
ncbi:MAG: DUF2283 domain-containing protein [Chloroflexi bacterium]|nr:DUF2283 domain-containing protein [Chloroflexota bacterium]